MRKKGKNEPEGIGDILPRVIPKEMSLVPKGEPVKSSKEETLKGKGLTEKTIDKRVDTMLTLHDEIDHSQASYERTEALRMARLVAITSLPKRQIREREISKSFRLGKDLWAKVTLTALRGQSLPYGEDRFVLAGIMHLALENDSPIVFFNHAGQLLKMFDISRDSQGYRSLRERFKRISGLAITIQYGQSEEDIQDGRIGENIFVIYRYALPTKAEIDKEEAGQLMLPTVLDNPEFGYSPYGVRLGAEFWEYLRDPKNHLIAPLKLLKLFIDQPTGWDYALFLVYRCGAAKTSSVINHETLMALFKEGREPDRNTVARLKRYHEQIMTATQHRLNAKIIEDGYFSKQGRGRKQKKWKLCVGPSQPIIWSGKKPGLLETGDN